MAIHAERAFFEELLPTGNSLVKKCPLMTSLHAGLVLLYYYYENTCQNDTKC